MTPSTRPHTHLCTAHLRFGRTKRGQRGHSEVVRGGHMSYITVEDSSFEPRAKVRACSVSRVMERANVSFNQQMQDSKKTQNVPHLSRR